MQNELMKLRERYIAVFGMDAYEASVARTQRCVTLIRRGLPMDCAIAMYLSTSA